MKRLGAFFYLLFCMMLMMTTTAHAYLDPSVTTYMIQAIAGIAIAVGAVITIYWRKAKKKVSQKLGIDENSKKEVEEDVKIISDDNGKKQ